MNPRGIPAADPTAAGLPVAPPAWIDRQMPEGDEVFLDHVGFFVADLEAAGAAVERLGFQISQVNVQTNEHADGSLHPSGTSNRIVRLNRGYLEILAATHDTPLGDQLRAGLARYPGLHLVALCHDDIPGTRERLAATGFAMQDVVHLRRRDKTLPGEPEVAWSVLRPQAGIMPEGRVQFAKSLNPDRVWQPELCVHANAVDALTDIVFCVEDRPAVAARYGLYVGRPVVETGAAGIVSLERGRLVFVAPDDAESLFGGLPPSLPFIAGQALRSADIKATRKTLVGNGVEPLHADEGLILVGPDDGLGAYLLFHAASIAEPWATLAARR